MHHAYIMYMDRINNCHSDNMDKANNLTHATVALTMLIAGILMIMRH